MKLFNLVFDLDLGRKSVGWWRAGKEGKGLERSRWNGRKKCLYQGDDRSHMQGNRRLNNLYRYVCRGAERAIRMRDVPIRMDVDCLDGSTRNDQPNTQESKEKFPGTLTYRI
jgi:hypothetical protein